MYNTLTDGERDILNELNAEAGREWAAEWYALTDEEREEALADTMREIDIANTEAALYWAVEAQERKA